MVSQGVLVANSTLGEGMYSAGGDWELEWDEDSQTPFVWNTVTGEWITYDDPTSISIKRNYCASMGMLGMMVWEVEYDTDAGILMSYMN